MNYGFGTVGYKKQYYPRAWKDTPMIIAELKSKLRRTKYKAIRSKLWTPFVYVKLNLLKMKRGFYGKQTNL